MKSLRKNRRTASLVGLSLACSLSLAAGSGETRTIPGPGAVSTREFCDPFVAGGCDNDVTVDDSGHAVGEFSIASPLGGTLPGRGSATIAAQLNFEDTVDSELDSIAYQAVFHVRDAGVHHDGLLHANGTGLSGEASVRVTAAAFSLNDCSRGSGAADIVSSENPLDNVHDTDVVVSWTLQNTGCDTEPIPDVVYPGTIAIRLEIDGVAVLQGETVELGRAYGSFDVSLVEVTATDVPI